MPLVLPALAPQLGPLQVVCWAPDPADLAISASVPQSGSLWLDLPMAKPRLYPPLLSIGPSKGSVL
jgi:hypothetical protein